MKKFMSKKIGDFINSRSISLYIIVVSFIFILDLILVIWPYFIIPTVFYYLFSALRAVMSFKIVNLLRTAYINYGTVLDTEDFLYHYKGYYDCAIKMYYALAILCTIDVLASGISTILGLYFYAPLHFVVLIAEFVLDVIGISNLYEVHIAKRGYYVLSLFF